MSGRCYDHSSITDRERTADESTQDVRKKNVVRIQLNDVPIASMIWRVAQ
jgi:hypothetical protein